MKIVQGLSVGWLNSSIGLFARQEIDLPSTFNSVLITSIDSTRDMHKVLASSTIVGRHPECKFFGEGLIVPGHLVAELAATYSLFSGFDEIWCFEEEPVRAKPQGLVIVSPLNFESDSIPPELFPWMKDTQCRLAMGDGIGLNYATPDEEIARSLERLTASIG
jgi:hypothetical protein